MFSKAGERQPSLEPTIPFAAINGTPYLTRFTYHIYFLSVTLFLLLQGARMSTQVPRVAWFARQREALGLEAMLYAFIAIGKT
jgi:hypothetical protein